MDRIKRLAPSPALLVAMTALVVAMSGVAVGLPGKGTVSSNDIKKGAVKSKTIAKQAVKTKNIARGAVGSKQVKGKSLRGNRLRDGTVKAKQIADGTITANKVADKAITAQQIADGTIGSQQVAANGLNTGNLSDVKLIGPQGSNLVRATATEAAGIDEAQAAAPAVPLFSKGQITLYGKCFTSTETDVTISEIYVETTAPGAIYEGPEGELTGGPAASDFLNPDTPEDDRVVEAIAIIGAEAEMNQGVYNVAAANGVALMGQVTAAAKNGNLAGGNGVYGDGNVCLFGGSALG